MTVKRSVVLKMTSRVRELASKIGIQEPMPMKSKTLINEIIVNFPLLMHYYSLHGNLDCEIAYVTPKNDSKWPSHHQGKLSSRHHWTPAFHCFVISTFFLTIEMRIGKYLAYLRHEIRENPTRFSSETLEKLMSLKLKVREHNHVGFNVIRSGHVKVPQDFVVPENDCAYPESCWGLKLGYTLYHIRSRGDFAQHRDKLEALGVDFNVSKYFGFDVIYSALVAYKSVNGHVKVPARFVVPENDSAYPESSWGLKLGGVLRNIRNNNAHAQHRELLEALGVVSKKWTAPAAAAAAAAAAAMVECD